MTSSDPQGIETGHGSGELKVETNDQTSDPTAGFETVKAPVQSLAGQALGEYLLLEQIGSGGGGQVYRAQHRHMDRIVALKVFSHGALGDEVQVKRFYREVRAAAKLVHPNVVMAFDAGEFRSMHFLAMEYVDGMSLAKLVQSAGPLTVRQATQCIVQAAQGLAYAHGEGIVHRDVKPDNIMVDRAGTVKLLDMGLARWQGIAFQEAHDNDSTSLTAQGIVLGTVGYISPEQIADASSVDERSDIYSLGCTLYFLLAGKSPYKGTILEVFRAHAEAPIPCLKHVRNDVPYGLDTAYQRMLAKDPLQRPASMKEVVAALEPYCTDQADEGGTSAAQESTQPRAGRSSSVVVVDAGAALGFDLSTRYLYVSSINEDGEPVLVKDSDGALATPAVLLYKRGAFEYGSAAFKSAKGPDGGLIEQLTSRLGVDKPAHRIAGQPVPNEALAAALIARRCTPIGQSPELSPKLCYTIPACDGDARRRAYRDAYFIALGRECMPVNSTAAVATQFCFLHGWLNPNHSLSAKSLLVFRCGSTSFDATVYRMEDRRLVALATVNDTRLGEFTWDNRVVERLLERMEPGPREIVTADKKQIRKLLQQVDAVKAALAKGSKRVTLRVRVAGQVIEETLSYPSLGRMGGDVLDRFQALTEQALSESGLEWGTLDHVLLAGSAARMPFVHEAVKRWSGDRDICFLAGPEIASEGAALVAENLSGMRNSTLDFGLQDVASLSYGIRTTDPATGVAKTQVVIPRGTPLPTTARGTVQKRSTRQTEIEFEVVELDDTNPDAATVLGNCSIGNLPPGLLPNTPVEVEFSLDARGILSLYSISLATGRRFAPAYQTAIGMTADERAHWRNWLQTLG
jgi:molecular chaperone DnaK (HSP70)/tRNA A-37 threonylcarbamoyl transferase component Bud32